MFVQVAGKRIPEEEAEAQAWIEAVIGERFPAGSCRRYMWIIFYLYTKS